MKRALIGGIGNVLLGDDGIGPYVIRLLESMYSFDKDVEIVDLGTPALGLTHQIAGLHSLILVDSVARDKVREDTPAGTLQLYRKEDILREEPLAQRVDPHSPALSECLMTAAMLGSSPEHVLLVGIVGKTYEPGNPLSADVRESVVSAIDAILHELQRLDFPFRKKPTPDEPGIWWSNLGAELSVEERSFDSHNSVSTAAPNP